MITKNELKAIAELHYKHYILCRRNLQLVSLMVSHNEDKDKIIRTINKCLDATPEVSLQ